MILRSLDEYLGWDDKQWWWNGVRNYADDFVAYGAEQWCHEERPEEDAEAKNE